MAATQVPALIYTWIVHVYIYIYILVGGLVAIFYFPILIGLLIIPIDFHIFQRGGKKKKNTNQS